MAITLESIRNSALTSIHGRRLGIDNADFLVGVRGVRTESIAATSATTGTALLNYGLSLMGLTTGAAKVYTLTAPDRAGLRKELVMTSSPTKGTQITLSGASLVSTGGSSATSIKFLGIGQRAILESVSTASWVALHLSGTST